MTSEYLQKWIDFSYTSEGMTIQLMATLKYCSTCELFETCEWSWLNFNNAGCWE